MLSCDNFVISYYFDGPVVLTLDTAIQHYLKEVLGIFASEPRLWARESELPYFLRDAFQINELDLLGHSVLLAIDRKTADKPLLGEVRAQLNKVRALAGQRVLYCTGASASYERGRFIEQRLSKRCHLLFPAISFTCQTSV